MLHFSRLLLIIKSLITQFMIDPKFIYTIGGYMLKNATLNTEKLPEVVQKKFIPYLSAMRKIHPDTLVSVFIYGSAAGENYISKAFE